MLCPHRLPGRNGKLAGRRSGGAVTSVIVRVAAALREAIVSGEYRSSERLNQMELANRLGVSRVPVREALRLLEAEGLVIFDHNHGAKVAHLSPDNIRDIFEMRTELEVLALRSGLAAATERDVETARGLLMRMESLKDHPDEWLRLNGRFHMALYAPGRRSRLFGIIRNLRQAIDPYVRMYLVVLQRFQTSHAQHARMLEAYGRRDAAAAEAVLREHLIETMRDLLRMLGPQRASARGRW